MTTILFLIVIMILIALLLWMAVMLPTEHEMDVLQQDEYEKWRNAEWWKD